MNRRNFLRSGLGAAGAALVSTPALGGGADAPDLVLRNATVYDGTGAPPVEADVAVEGGRIAAVGRRLSGRGRRELELRGLALAPGFIDIHSHTDLTLLVDPRAESKVRQGVTTEVVGQDGGSVGPWRDDELAETKEGYRKRYGVDIDFRDLDGFFRRLERQGAAVHVASMIGAGTLRGFVVGEDNRPATEAEIRRMQALVVEALKVGARGVSSGLEYTPGAFADTAELIALSTPMKGMELPYASHMRNEDDRLFAAVEEALAVGRAAGVPVEISHLKAQGAGNWWKQAPVLDTIETARKSGLDAMFDVYPYVAYSTGLANLFPTDVRDGGNAAFLARLRDPAMRERLESAAREKVAKLGSWDAVQVTSTSSDSLAWARGRRLGSLAQERRVDPYELLVQIIVGDSNRAGMVGFGMSEENVEALLRHPLAAICSDAGARAVKGPLSEGSPHPRAYGTYPRVLGHYCRDRKTLPLEEAIKKMTSVPAARLKLADRGRIAPGLLADLVAFDPDKVSDPATFERPHQYAVGIPYVIVAGEVVIREGEHTNALPGRPVRAADAAHGAAR
ncbi:MAG TPA: D-aminoacylase [Longimicrobiales bacterium]|nr:D-aminoacylase [Longimicrobiales bacterium]